MARVVSEQSIWRQLCRFHWNWQQIQYMIRQHKELQVKRDWELIYHKLRKYVIMFLLVFFYNYKNLNLKLKNQFSNGKIFKDIFKLNQ